jgi:hypothetical protein
MNETSPTKDLQRLLTTLPAYLAVQVTLLVVTYLDFPVYYEVYRALGYLTVTGWWVIWLLLAIFGLVNAVALLTKQAWKLALPGQTHAQYAAGYLLGFIAGLVTLGIRFLPLVPPFYFILVGCLLLGEAGYVLWNRRQSKTEEIFP